MIGAIIGDIAGSIYEFHNIKTRPPHGRQRDDAGRYAGPA